MRTTPRIASIAALLVLSSCEGCRDTPFAYDTHAPPRVSVIHRPLHPAPGETITIIARPEAAPGRTVAEVRITLIRPGGPGSEEQTCGPGDLTPEGWCELTVAGTGEGGTGIYGASMTDDAGSEGRAPSSYTFLIGSPPAGERVIALRVPLLVPAAQLFRVLLVRDRDSFSTDAAALAAAESMLYDGVLEDPVHRWRDAQLAIYYTTRHGITRDYHSGMESRCGGRPWAGTVDETTAEAEAAPYAVLGVLHLEDYRDCAGAGLGATAQRRFSAKGTDATLFQHEFGHALALLSDEYNEPTSSRQMRTDSIAQPWQCECCDPGGSDTIVGGGVTGGVTGGTTGGVTTIPTPQQLCPPGAPPCNGFVKPPICYDAPPLCPQLGSGCLKPNIFPGQAACQAAVVEINAHPGIELVANAADCRLLCAGDDCPCMLPGSTAEFWILDRRTPPAAAPVNDDIMGERDALQPLERHGPACAHCLEVTYCMRWETGRGRTEADALAHCTG
jgi:hypothetical protein